MGCIFIVHLANLCSAQPNENTDMDVEACKIHSFTILAESDEIQCHEKVFAPFLFFLFLFAYLSHLKDSDHQTNFYITQR